MAEPEVIDLSGRGNPNDYNDGGGGRAAANASRKRRRTTPLMEVLEVFPDAKTEFVNQLLRECADQIEVVVQRMMEHPYEKVEKKTQQTATDWNNNANKMDYMSPQSFHPSPLYRTQAKTALLQAFRFLSAKQADSLLAQASFHYSIAHDRIWKALLGDGTMALSLQAQLDRVMAATTKGIAPLAHFPFPPLKKPRQSAAHFITEATLQNETDLVAQKCSSWINEAMVQLKHDANKQIANATGNAMECSCCCDTDDISQMIACTDAHLFCRDCIKNYATTQIFGSANLGMDKKTKKPALALQCCYGECTATFDRPFLERALDQKTLQKYDEIAFTLSVDAAGVTVHRCPRCDFAADVPENQRVFSCLQCQFESCMECGEASHIPLKCVEVQKDKKDTSNRVTVEEAISAALIRKCPSCKKPFIKSDGCNKMRCGCGAFSCYLCQQRINGYEHFCQTPHCVHTDCRKCPLHSKPEDDLNKMRAAANQAVTEIGTTDVDVDQILAIK